MARLINAENVEYAFLAICDRESGVPLALAEWLANVVRNAPTVDAVEVVRCKDCKHCYKATFSSTGYRCKVWGVYDKDCEVTPEHYCSYGERKDDA